MSSVDLYLEIVICVPFCSILFCFVWRWVATFLSATGDVDVDAHLRESCTSHMKLTATTFHVTCHKSSKYKKVSANSIYHHKHMIRIHLIISCSVHFNTINKTWIYVFFSIFWISFQRKQLQNYTRRYFRFMSRFWFNSPNKSINNQIKKNSAILYSSSTFITFP